MASKFSMKNELDNEFSIVHNDNNDAITIDTADLSKVITIDSLKELKDKVGGNKHKPKTIWISGYHKKEDGAFGSHIFEWDEYCTDSHNGGTIIDPNAIFPTDWNNSTQVNNWFNYSSTTTGRYKLKYNGAINIKWFGANITNVDNSISITKALFVGNIFCDLGTLKSSSFTVPSNRIVDSLDIDFSQGGTCLVDSNSYNIVFKNCKFSNSPDSDGLFIRNSEKITIDSCVFSSNKLTGLTTFNCNFVTIINSQSMSNKRHGFYSYGDVLISECSEITYENCVSHHNGEGYYSGFSVLYCENTYLINCSSYSNAEHGFVIEGSNKVYLDLCRGNNNNISGITLQENIANQIPTIKVTITNCEFIDNGTTGNTTRESGIIILDRNENISIDKCLLLNNKNGKGINVIQSGSGSGILASKIYVTNNKLFDEIAETYNSINLWEAKYTYTSGNIYRAPTYNLVNTDTTTSSGILNVNGSTSGNHEVLLVSGTNTVTAVSLGSSIQGRKITVIATDPNGFTIGHNATTSGYAPFILSGSTNAQLTQYSSITFYCDGSRWIEIARSIK